MYTHLHFYYEYKKCHNYVHNLYVHGIDFSSLSSPVICALGDRNKIVVENGREPPQYHNLNLLVLIQPSNKYDLVMSESLASS